jgi:hypothetical protein
MESLGVSRQIPQRSKRTRGVKKEEEEEEEVLNSF